MVLQEIWDKTRHVIYSFRNPVKHLMVKKLLRALYSLNIVAKISILNACMVLNSPLSMMLMKQFLKPSDKNLKNYKKF